MDVPEKFLVKNAAGEIDHAATSRKMAASYLHLEKRIGTGDLPPADPAGYKLERRPIEGVQASDPEAMKPIIARLHAAKLTQGQLQEVFNIYDDLVEQGQTITKQQADQATATLRGAWGDKFDAKLADAKFALAAVASGAEREHIIARYGADPVILQVLAIAGAELRESPMTAMDPAQMTSIDELRGSEAYNNPKHPDHKRVAALVADAYSKGYKATRKP